MDRTAYILVLIFMVDPGHLVAGLIVDMCEDREVTSQLEPASSIQIMFDTQRYTLDRWPLACNASIIPLSTPEFVLSSYQIQFANKDGITAQWNVDQSTQWTPGYLKYWRCIGAICANATIKTPFDFVYYHQKSELRFYLELNSAPSDVGPVDRSDVTGVITLTFTGEITVFITTVNVNRADDDNDGQSEQEYARTGAAVKREGEELKYILPIVLSLLLFVIIMLLACLYLRHRKKRMNDTRRSEPPPYTPPVADTNQYAMANNATNISKEMLTKTELLEQDVIDTRGTNPPTYSEISHDVTKVPLDNTDDVTNVPDDVVKVLPDETHVVEANTYDNVTPGEYTVKLQLTDESSPQHQAPVVMYVSGATPPAYDNQTYVGADNTTNPVKK